jgi:hypothetical protein
VRLSCLRRDGVEEHGGAGTFDHSVMLSRNCSH